MNTCKRIRDILLTGYPDGELDRETKRTIDAHLPGCSGCREFYTEIKQDISFLKQIPRQPVPEHLWASIKERIQGEEVSSRRAGDAVRAWIESFLLPKPALGFLGALLLFFLGISMLQHYQIQQAQEKDQGEYLVSVLTDSSSVGLQSQDDEDDWGTPIEKYFL